MYNNLTDLVVTSLFTGSKLFNKIHNLLIVMQKTIHTTRPEIIPVIKEYIDTIYQKYNNIIVDVILYGSVARGEDKKDSDIDLLVVGTSDDWKFERELIDIAYDIGLMHGLYLSIKYISQNEFLAYQSFSFFKNIQEEGISIVS